MNIEDFEIKIKKYDREKNVVIVHLLILKIIEIRGFIVRYALTRYSHGSPVWIVSPPSVRIGKFYFWQFRCINLDLWKEIEKKMIELAIEYTNAV